MSYRRIRANTKMDAVIRVLRGESVTEVAIEIGTDRSSIARWIRKAEEAISKCLECNGNNQNEHRQVRPEETAELLKLKKTVKEQRKQIKRLRALVEERREGPHPTKCTKCGCERFYKKGFIQLQLRTLLKMQRNCLQDKIPVQKFACVNCGHATHLKGPVALYHWVISKVK